MQKTILGATLFLSVAHMVCADSPPNLQITGEEITVNATQSSCWLTLGIENTGITNSLLSWQVSLQIVPIGAAPDTAVFTELDDYTPTNYVFGSFSWGIIRSDMPAGDADFSDMAKSGFDGTVPSSGKNLLHLLFMCPDATGRFDIRLVPYNELEYTGSFWSDNNFITSPFDVVPVSDRPGSDIVASIEFLPVPEPSTILMLASVIISVIINALEWRRFS